MGSTTGPTGHPQDRHTELMRRRLRSPTLVGRHQELGVLDGLAVAVEAGQGQLVVVAGDAGVGKTRLVEELVARRQAQGWVTAVGGGVALGDEGLTHAALRGILRSLDAQLGADQMDDLTGAGFAELHALAPGAPAAGDLEVGRLYEQVLTFAQRLGDRQPVLLVFEDMHWADAATRGLLAFLARNVGGARLLAVITYRRDDVPRRHPLRSLLAELNRSAAAVVELGGLDREEIAELGARLAGAALSAAQTSELLARTGGNPFFVEELLGAGPGIDQLPDAVRDLVLTRLEQLPEPTRDLLRPASVLGRLLDDRVLAAISGLPAGEIEAALEAGVAAQVLEVDLHGCRFRHDLVREALYDDLLPGQRLRLHRDAAQAIEADVTLVDPPGQRFALLAYHWGVTGNADRALDASIQAGRWARSMGAMAEAADHFEMALTHWEQATVTPDTDQVQITLDAAEARRRAGQYRRAVELGLDAQERLTRSTGAADLERQALASLDLGLSRLTEADFETATLDVQHAVDLLADQPASATKALVLARYAGLLMVTSRSASSLEAADAAIAAAVALGDRRVEGHARNTRGVVLAELGRPHEALDQLHEAVAIASEIGHRDDLARAHQNLTYVQLAAGLAAEALSDARVGLEIVRQQGGMLSSGVGIAEHQAMAAVRLGRLDEALQVLDDFPFQDLEGTARCSFAGPRFDVWLRRGALDEADTVLTSALAVAEGAQDVQFGANTRIRAAQLALARGDLATARTRVDEALARSDRVDDFLYVPKTTWLGVAIEGVAARRQPRSFDRARADALVARTDVLEQRQRALGGQGLAAEPQAFAVMTRAEWASLEGAAPEPWSDAVDAWLACDDAYWTAAARLRLADALVVTQGDRARAGRSAGLALDAARAMGATPLIDEINGFVRRARLLLTDVADPSRDGDAGGSDLGLTSREAEVLDLVADGLTNREIGTALYISPKTASVHVSNVMRKLGVDSRREAAEVARRQARPTP
jgi:DNA-binding CsgD family transcriptional regulator/tetratricopeptide (TPR) repeat protein